MSTKIVQAECKSKRSLRFCRGAAYPSGGSSPQSVHAECKSKLVRGFAEAQPIRAEARPPQSVQTERRTKFIWILPKRRLSKRRLRPPQSGARRAQKQPAIGNLNLRIKIRNSVPSSRGCVRIGCCRSCGSKSAEHAHSGGLPRAEASARAALSAALLQQGIVTARQDAVLIAWRLLLPSLIRIFG